MANRIAKRVRVSMIESVGETVVFRLVTGIACSLQKFQNLDS